MQQNRPRLSAVTINLNKQFFAMVFFLITFIGASYYAPEHLPQQPPQARGSVAKILKINLLPLNLLINLQIKTTFSFLLH